MSSLPSLQRLALSSVSATIPEKYLSTITSVSKNICAEEFHHSDISYSIRKIKEIMLVYFKIILNSRAFIQYHNHRMQRFSTFSTTHLSQFSLLKFINPFFLIKCIKKMGHQVLEDFIKGASYMYDTTTIELLSFAFFQKMTKQELGLALHGALICDAQQSVDLLLQSKNLPIEGEHSFGTAFCFCAKYASDKMLQKFVDCKEKFQKMNVIPSPPPCESDSFSQAFCYALENDKTENVKLLLRCTEQFNRMPVEGQYYSFTEAFCTAALKGNSEILELLLQCESKFKEMPINGDFSFSRAVCNAALQEKNNTLQQLLNCKSVVRQMEGVEEEGYSLNRILFLAAKFGNSETLQILLSCEKMQEVPLDGKYCLREAISNAQNLKEENAEILEAYAEKHFGRIYEPERKRRKIQ